ncbi:chromate efflux transporter [Ectobacillus panaciterrae]|uniref:chromate efflux transporter n=1 Tax=Ectobacillus panaciterrae TaxID=363872 RepID=UPI00041CF390|nr:chromate efflux transporter [Ectobacillus panaciterrae]
MKQYWNVFWTAFRLGCTSFGGPAAHIGYFRNEYVTKRKWLDEKSYADLVALANFLPGPASSQVGIAIGTMRAGIIGGFFAWLGFTLPSALVLALFAMLVKTYRLDGAAWIHSLKLVAVVIVAQAVFDMGKKLAPDRIRQTIILGAAAAVLWFSTPYMQIIVLLLSGIIGYMAYRKTADTTEEKVSFVLSKRAGGIAFFLFFALLFLLPVAGASISSPMLQLFDIMYRTGALVFGGGHVVLPLLENEIVRTSLMNKEIFLAGYGLTQAMPGPLFTFSSYIGTTMYGIGGAATAVIGIFLPAFLLIIGGLSFWNTMHHNKIIRTALVGVNAGVVGILLAALYDPIFTSSVKTVIDAVLVLVYFALFSIWKLPPWALVLVALLCGVVVL